MIMRHLAPACILLLLFAGCAETLPTVHLTDSPSRSADRVLAGRGEAYRFDDGRWIRLPSYDYEFSVVQRFLDDGWESMKVIHRRHPAYDGRAGARDQTLYFRVQREETSPGAVLLRAVSTMGSGEGKADSSLTHISIDFRPGISRFAPFNTYRITQEIGNDRVAETIELLKITAGREIPFMKMIEEAVVFEPVRRK